MIPEDAEQRNASFRSSSWLHHRLEQLIFGSRLVFNQTWEDPLVDRHALAITPDDVLVTIASAGDNVLALSLDKPKHIYAVDLNPAQIFLLQLKIIAAQQLKYADFWYLFSLNPAPHARSLYYNRLRQHLDQDAQQFWDRHISEFRRGLGRSGVFGRSLWLLRMYLRVVCGQRTLAHLFEASSLSTQAEFYREQIHGRWWNFLAKPFADHFAILLLFGAHPYQARRIRRQQFADFLEEGIQRVLTTLPMRDNFFWQQAFLGKYLTPPDYAQPETFDYLKEVVSRIETYVGRIENLLVDIPRQSVTCFNLLDAPDWLSPEQTAALWRLIERAAAPGARVLFRTIDPSYQLPNSILLKWCNMTNPSWTLEERTGAYAHVFLYVLSGGSPLPTYF